MQKVKSNFSQPQLYHSKEKMRNCWLRTQSWTIKNKWATILSEFHLSLNYYIFEARKEAIRGLADSVSLSTDLIRKLVDSVTATGDWVTKVDAVDESYDENSNIARPDIRDVDVKAFEDDRSSDIYVAPDRTKWANIKVK